MNALLRAALIVWISGWVAGCATSTVSQTVVVTSLRKTPVAPERASTAIELGKSSKADVRAALGETLALSFDSGYEVWVYRLASTRAGEYVILFSPAGVVTKTRVRLAPSN